MPTQVSPSLEARAETRALDDDRVSLNSSAEAGRSMTKRFASMLKQYSNTRPGYDDVPEKGEADDSLTALLKRQSSHRAQNSDIKLKEDSPLARLIAEDRRLERPKPQLDPSRYERNSSPREAAVSNEDLTDMREEMTSIRRLLEHQVSGLMWQEVERREPLRAMLIKRLERMGLSLELADQLACYIPEDTPPKKAWRALLA
ncbi:flagellar biosynthesis protein FlhF [Vibrio ponticus]|nr:flagellar biosynthesis protein FlhF [Vibrio ponticus]